MSREVYRGPRFFAVFVLATLTSSFFLISAARSAQNPGADAQSIVDILRSPAVLVQVLAGSAVITAVINVIWFVMSGALRNLQHWWNAKGVEYAIELKRGITKANYEELRQSIGGFYCLVVRYGSDQYISSLANEQEKYEGRLKNKVLPVLVGFDEMGGRRADA